MFSKTVLVGLSALSLAAAQYGSTVSSVLFFTHVGTPVTDGQSTSITWSTNDTTTPASIILRKGVASDLQTVSVVTDSALSGQFVWTPPSNLPNGDDYALEIKQNDQINYFGPFTVQGYVANSTSSSSNSSSSSSSSNMAGMPTGFPALGGAGSNSTSKNNSTMSRNSTSSSSSMSMTSTMDMSSSAPAPTMQASQSAKPSGSAADAVQVGSGLALALGAFAAALL